MICLSLPPGLGRHIYYLFPNLCSGVALRPITPPYSHVALASTNILFSLDYSESDAIG